LRDLSSQISRFQSEREVPTESDLGSVRQHRESGWRLVRQAWKEGKTDQANEAAFVSSSGRSRELADAYEWSVDQTDQIADRLRREADRIAQLVNFRSELAKKTEACDQLTAKIVEAEGQLARAIDEWQEQWKPIGIQALSPKEMRSWLQ